ncbi:MAG: hypothetical protein KDG50_12530 [Chromatiales bacterium]|nr:hypothetical protein [Chromatiales bacterium]
MLRRFLCPALLVGALQTSVVNAVPMLSEVLAVVPEQHWAVVNTNTFQSAWPAPALRDFETARGTPGPLAVMQAFSSFGWDTRRQQFYLYGGGHGNYPGNEIYIWDAKTLEWRRGSLPSQVQQLGSTFTYVAVDGADNAPTAAHTYDNNEYLPIADRFIVFGGAAWDSGGPLQDAAFNRVGPYLWDPSLADPNMVGGTTGSHTNATPGDGILGGEMWENRNLPLLPNYLNDPTQFRIDDYYSIEGATDVVSRDGHDLVYLSTRHWLWEYHIVDVNDPSQDFWRVVGNGRIGSSGVWGQGPGAYDEANNLFVRIAEPRNNSNRLYDFYYFDLETPGFSNPVVPFEPTLPDGSPLFGGGLDSNLFNFKARSAWGLDYDPVREQIVLWDGAGNLWALTPPDMLGANGWIATPIDVFALAEFGLPNANDNGYEINGVTPAADTGVLGKFKYIPEFDIYLTTYHTQTGDIWIYKPEGWTPNAELFPFLFVPAPASPFLLLIGGIGWSIARARYSFTVAGRTSPTKRASGRRSVYRHA